jgi:cytochrome c-type biogenesis protein CcmF
LIPELGHFALIVALGFALMQGVLPLIGAARGHGTLIALARPAARAQFVFIALAYAALSNAFVANDFSVLYVAQHSNSALPLVYRLTAVWGGHEGSILLWVLILAGWTLAVTEKRGGFRMWTALLAIVTFSLSLLGTFIVRSGVLTSVHAFASDPTRGVFILGFLALVIGGSLLLFAWRAPRVAAMGAGAGFETVSRESMLLANNVLLLVACASVMLGTLYPLVIDALGLGKLSVGPPYFNAVFVPLMAPALFLMGVGPLARWRRASAIELALRLRWAAGVSLATALLTPLLLGSSARALWTPMVGFGLLRAAWIASTAVLNLATRLREHPAPSWSRRLRAQPGSYYGMLLAHAGVAVFIVGVTVVGGFAVEKDVRMAPGDTVTIAPYVFKLEGLSEHRGPNYLAVRATLGVTDDGRPIDTLAPERRVYTVSRSPMTETAIDRGVTRDLYVALGDAVGPNAWGMRVYYKPFVGWIWGGCLLMALGGVLAVLDRRYRVVRRPFAQSARPALDPAPSGRPALALKGAR